MPSVTEFLNLLYLYHFRFITGIIYHVMEWTHIWSGIAYFVISNSLTVIFCHQVFPRHICWRRIDVVIFLYESSWCRVPGVWTAVYPLHGNIAPGIVFVNGGLVGMLIQLCHKTVELFSQRQFAVKLPLRFSFLPDNQGLIQEKTQNRPLPCFAQLLFHKKVKKYFIMSAFNEGSVFFKFISVFNYHNNSVTVNPA